MVDRSGLNTVILDRLPENRSGEKLVFGFDGYIDQVREIVDERQDRASYSRLRNLHELGDQISTAAAEERSILMEWVRSEKRTGGHACHVPRALEQFGYRVTMYGMYGKPPKEIFVDEFRHSEIRSIGEPSYVDAIDLEDGKFMLTDSGDVQSLDWDTLISEVDFDRLADDLDGAALLGMGYWAEISDMISIFDGLADELFPTLSSPPEHVLIDPSDVGKRPTSEIRSGKDALRKIDRISPVTMSANRFETKAIADSLTYDGSDRSDPAAIAREQLGITRFISHEKTQSILTSESESVRMGIPKTDEPVLSTGAGDHFNAGVVIGLIHDLSPEEIVALGNAVAGCFVRQGKSPSHENVRAFLDSYNIQNWI